MFMFGWEAVHEPHEVAGEEEDGPTPDPPFRGRPFGETVYFIFAYFVFASLCLVLFFISRSVYILTAKEVILFVLFNLLKRELSESGRDEWSKKYLIILRSFVLRVQLNWR